MLQLFKISFYSKSQLQLVIHHTTNVTSLQQLIIHRVYYIPHLMLVFQKLQQLLPTKKLTIDVNDTLLTSTIPYYLISVIIFAGIFALQHHSFVFIFIIYALLPLLDELLTLDWRNPTKEERIKLQQDNVWFKASLFVSIVMDWLMFFKVMHIYANYDITIYTALNLVGLIFIVSSLNAVQFAVAHQIFHKNTFFDKLIGTLHMSKLLYMHFTYEHLWGHHKRVATPQDPGSAQKGINSYKFVKRSFIGSYKSVYRMEIENKKPIYLNVAVLSVIAAVLFSLLMLRIYGAQAFILYVLTGSGAIIYLEAINYIQHYGLRRELKQNGQYEKVTIRHSWNAPHRISNYLLFKLQRHSDHHENSLKPFQTLVSLQDSPQLSHGYTLTILMSFFPNTWFNVMDPLVDQYEKKKTGCIDTDVRIKANKLIRIFILQITAVSIALTILNYFILSFAQQNLQL